MLFILIYDILISDIILLYTLMTKYSFLQKVFSFIVSIFFLIFISPLSVVNATATLTGTVEVPTPSSNTTPSYTFESNASGIIGYT